MNSPTSQWINEQVRLARTLYLIFDCEGEEETRQAFLTLNPTPKNISVYSQTPISSMAAYGPFIFEIDSAMKPLLTSLLESPQRNWGWLASSESQNIATIVEHWRARIIVGERPQQSIYRFQDNRVLAQALNHIPAKVLPEYLGPLTSVLYWSGEHWATDDNPNPGTHPVPANPAWLEAPTPPQVSRAILHSNISRYLLAEHFEKVLVLPEEVNASHWITAQLDLADEWDWTTPEQLHFLIMQRLKEEQGSILKSWLPLKDEAPQAHYERLYKEAEYWVGDSGVSTNASWN